MDTKLVCNVFITHPLGNTPLLEACSQGHVTVAKLLLDRGADIDAPTGKGSYSE